MMNGLMISIPQRMTLLRITLVLSVVTGVALSFNLWGGYRSFPYAPLFEHNPIPPPFDFVFIMLAVVMWLLSLILKGERMFLFIAFLLCFFLVLFDVNRLQPWFYLYNAMLCVYVFYSGRVDYPNKFTSFFIMLQVIFAAAYFFTGVSQLNRFFLDASFGELIEPLSSLVSERQFLFIKKMGFLSPFVFMFIGLGLTISPIRYLAITLAVLMHVCLLIFLFPSARSTNYALWFSNLSHMIMLVLLFSGKTKQRYFSPTFLFQQPLFYAVLFLFVIMPCFNSVNQWPDRLSFNFRSGNNDAVEITLTKNVYTRLPFYQRSFCVPRDSGFVMDYNAWCSHELHSDPFPSNRVFNSIYNELQQLSGNSGVKEIELALRPKEKLLCKP